jgi:hypothetical protein
VRDGNRSNGTVNDIVNGNCSNRIVNGNHGNCSNRIVNGKGFLITMLATVVTAQQLDCQSEMLHKRKVEVGDLLGRLSTRELLHERKVGGGRIVKPFATGTCC